MASQVWEDWEISRQGGEQQKGLLLRERMSCVAEVESRTEDGSFASTVRSPPSARAPEGQVMHLAFEPPSHGSEGLQLLMLVSQGILAAGSKPFMFSRSSK